MINGNLYTLWYHLTITRCVTSFYSHTSHLTPFLSTHPSIDGLNWSSHDDKSPEEFIKNKALYFGEPYYIIKKEKGGQNCCLRYLKKNEKKEKGENIYLKNQNIDSIRTKDTRK